MPSLFRIAAVAAGGALVGGGGLAALVAGSCYAVTTGDVVGGMSVAIPAAAAAVPGATLGGLSSVAWITRKNSLPAAQL